MKIIINDDTGLPPDIVFKLAAMAHDYFIKNPPGDDFPLSTLFSKGSIPDGKQVCVWSRQNKSSVTHNLYIEDEIIPTGNTVGAGG